MLRRQSTLVAVLLSVIASGTPAQQPNRNASTGSFGIVSAVLGASEHVGQVIGDLQRLRQASEDATYAIIRARTAYWSSYPEGEGHAAAAEEFGRQLFGKDLYYLSQNIMGENPMLAFSLANIDDGIPARARGEFNGWVAAVRKAMFSTTEGGRRTIRLSDFDPANMLAALEASWDEYEVYALERDWAEFIAARREPAWVKTPEQYISMLLMRDRGYDAAEAAAIAAELTQVLGEATITNAVGQVRGAEKENDGTISYWALESMGVVPRLSERQESAELLIRAQARVPEGVTLVRSRETLDVVVGLATRESPEGHVVALLQQNAVQPRSASGWRAAQAAYQQLVTTYGAPLVREASNAIRAAPRYMHGGLADPGALGVGQVTDPREALMLVLDVRSGRRAADTGPVPSTAVERDRNPVHAGWSTSPSTSGQWIDFWELVGQRGPRARVDHNRVFGLAEGENVALQVIQRTIQAGVGQSAERSSTVMYPKTGPESASTAWFLHSDRWPWKADVPGATVNSGTETLSINKRPIYTHWWSLSIPGSSMLKVAWFAESVPGGLVRAYTRSAEGEVHDAVAVYVSPGPRTTDDAILEMIGARLGTAPQSDAKPSGAPRPSFDGQNWTPAPVIPAGTRFTVVTTEVLDGAQTMVRTALKGALLIDGAPVLPDGTLFAASFQIVSQQTRGRATEWLGRFNTNALVSGFDLVQPFQATEVASPHADGNGLHRRPVPAGTEIVFEVR